MKPVFRLFLNNKDVTKFFNDRLLQLTFQDEPGIHADTLRITLDNRDSKVVMPDNYEEVSVELALGYEGEQLMDFGKLYIAEVSYSGWPLQVSLIANTCHWSNKFKEPKKASFDDISLSKLIKKLTEPHGIILKVHNVYKTLMIDHYDQTQPDMSTVFNLAKSYGAIAKIKNDKLYFVPETDKKPIDSKGRGMVSITKNNILDFQYHWAKRGEYAQVQADYYDISAAKVMSEKYPKSAKRKNIFRLADTFPDKEKAYHGAKARYELFNTHRAGQLQMTVVGGAYYSGQKANLQKVFQQIDGEWSLEQVTHILSPQSGYRCDLDLLKDSV